MATPTDTASSTASAGDPAGTEPAFRTSAMAMGGPAAILLAAAVALTLCRDAWYPREPADESVLYVTSGPTLTRVALSYDALLADLYWIRALQHFGGTRLRKSGPKKYELLYPLLSITTTLDPQFNIAYRFGAIFLSEPPPGGPGRPDQAIALLERGLTARPGNWRYMQDIGFVYYWSLRDYTQAAAWFRRAARQPGAPWWMQSLAATTAASGGDRATSRALWTALAQTPDNEWLRSDARWRLQQLDALDARDALQAAVRRYIDAGGRQPYTWDDLVRAGYLRARPLDPAGTPFYLGPYSGEVTVDDLSPLQPMIPEPSARTAR